MTVKYTVNIHFILALVCFLCINACSGCSDSSGQEKDASIDVKDTPGDAASDADADTDSDSDTDTDSDSDVEPDGIYYWHTFYGSTDCDEYYCPDEGRSIVVDSNNYIYVAGDSIGTWTGPSGETPINESNGGAYVLKLGPNGSYQWHTFIGPCSAEGIAIDKNDNIYITGGSSEFWEGPDGQPPLHQHSENNEFHNSDIFIQKMNSDGEYIWHTFYGTGEETTCWDPFLPDVADDDGTDIVVNDTNVFITGYSVNTWNGPAGQPPVYQFKRDECDSANVHVIKLDSDGGYEWHAFGGIITPYNRVAIELDSNNNIYTSGVSADSWKGPENAEPLYDTNKGGIFIISMNRDGIYRWHSFFGPTGNSNDLIADEDSKIYITGPGSAWRGPAGEEPLHEFTPSDDESSDIYVLKLDSEGIYEWHSFFGSSGYDTGSSIALDEHDSILISGLGEESWKGPEGQKPLNSFNGSTDILVLKLNQDGDYMWHFFFGSEFEDESTGMAPGSESSLYISGGSFTGWNGPSGQEPLHEHSSSNDEDADTDIVVIKLINEE